MCVCQKNIISIGVCYFSERPVYWECKSSRLFSMSFWYKSLFQISIGDFVEFHTILRWFLTRDVNAYMNYTLRPAMQSYLTPSISHLDTNGTDGMVQLGLLVWYVVCIWLNYRNLPSTKMVVKQGILPKLPALKKLMEAGEILLRICIYICICLQCRYG